MKEIREEVMGTGQTRRGMQVIASGETLAGAQRFRAGAGRHGEVE